MSKHRRVHDEAANLNSTNREFETSNNLVGTYEQTKKRIQLFYPKREVPNDGIHSKSLNW